MALIRAGKRFDQIVQTPSPIKTTKTLPATLRCGFCTIAPVAYTGAPKMREARIATKTALLFILFQNRDKTVGIIVDARHVP